MNRPVDSDPVPFWLAAICVTVTVFILTATFLAGVVWFGIPFVDWVFAHAPWRH